MSDLTMQAAQDRIEQLTKRAERLRSELASVERDIGALQRTIAIFNPAPPTRVRTQEYLNVDPDELRGKRLEEALIFIAERNKGFINSRAARYVLVDAGVLRGKPATTSHALSTELRDSEKFERLARGKYRLALQPDEADQPKIRPANEEARAEVELDTEEIMEAIEAEEEESSTAAGGDFRF